MLLTSSYQHLYILVFESLTLLLPESNLESINVAVPFDSVDESLVCDHSNKSY